MGTSANDYLGLADATNDLKARGYGVDFKMINLPGEAEDEDEAKVRLQSPETNQQYESNQLKVREHYRFEGESDPGDMSVIYALESVRGEKGVLIDAYGTYSSRRMAEFIRAIPIETDDSQAV